MNYQSPLSVADAVALLAADENACVLAGGTDLLVRLRLGHITPSTIVDIKRIGGMRTISQEDGGFRIGAAVTGAEMSEHASLGVAWPGVVEATDLIGSTQMQGRATPVGNLCNAGPAADSVPALVAAGAVVRVSGPNGTRDVAVEDIPTGPGKTSLAQGELVTSLFLPARSANSADAYLRFIPRTEMDIAVVGCGLSLTLSDAGTITNARVSLGAVAPTVLLLKDAADVIIGTKLDDTALDALASAASASAKPINDKRGTVAFRKDVSGVLARRAAKIAYSRAKGANK
jgi:CO/xanthine dehydrogenase FAD-binding subunit